MGVITVPEQREDHVTDLCLLLGIRMDDSQRYQPFLDKTYTI